MEGKARTRHRTEKAHDSRVVYKNLQEVAPVRWAGRGRKGRARIM